MSVSGTYQTSGALPQDDRYESESGRARSQSSFLLLTLLGHDAVSLATLLMVDVNQPFVPLFGPVQGRLPKVLKRFHVAQDHSSLLAELGLGLWPTRRRPISGDYAFARLGRQPGRNDL